MLSKEGYRLELAERLWRAGQVAAYSNTTQKFSTPPTNIDYWLAVADACLNQMEWSRRHCSKRPDDIPLCISPDGWKAPNASK